MSEAFGTYPNKFLLSCRCTKHEVDLRGLPEVQTKGLDTSFGIGLFRIYLFPHMSCPGMWNGDDELEDQICWDYWVAEVVAENSDRQWLHEH